MKIPSGLTEAHFDSEVALAVFNDKGSLPVNPMFREIELQVFDFFSGSPEWFLRRFAPRFDKAIFPALTPTGRRRVAMLIHDRAPQYAGLMPNVSNHLEALQRAVQMSRYLNKAAIDRIVEALRKEGLRP